MFNEPRTYRHPVFQVVILFVVFGVLAIGLFTSWDKTDFISVLPISAFFVIVFFFFLGRYVPGVRMLYGRVRKFRRLFDRKHARVQWLRPYPYMTVERMKRVIALARHAGAPVLNMTFHSSELMPGGSPYNKTEKSIEDLRARGVARMAR